MYNFSLSFNLKLMILQTVNKIYLKGQIEFLNKNQLEIMFFILLRLFSLRSTK